MDFFDKNVNICYHLTTEVADMEKILLGARIPEPVIIELREYCKSNGILINHFVSEAIEEKLRKIKRIERKKKEEK